jgi:Cof subfamily protein (haloacid dehalogenase superfamily)
MTIRGTSLPSIRLLVADIDGTLLTPDRKLTECSRQAVLRLHTAGVGFTLASARPPLGMRMWVESLRITNPFVAFNGGMLVNPDFSVLEEHAFRPEVAPSVVAFVEAFGLDAWVYRGTDWLVRQRHGPWVDFEARAVQFEPTAVAGLESALDRVVKVMAVSADPGAVARCEAGMRSRFDGEISVARSWTHFLDVTHPAANKGAAVRRLSDLLKVPTEEIATIGDMPTDTHMFAESGLSIAMGNASPEVRQAARQVTDSNEEEGFANAVACYVLGDCGSNDEVRHA